jgi:hypothetical protein
MVSMSSNRKFTVPAGLGLALLLAAGLAAEGHAGGSACAAKKGHAGCSSGAKATMAKSGCSPSQARATQTAEVSLPEGTRMARVDVEGGMDLVFTNADLTAVESFLNAHMEMCTSAAKAERQACRETCTVTRDDKEKRVVLSIRGQKAEECCATWMEQASLTDDAGEGVAGKERSQQKKS